jgi:uncharacterized membrane protein YkvA (DUF1232 family)
MDSRELENLATRFDEDSFWKKVGRFARRAGREVIEKVLVLYYCLQDPDTPKWARRVIMGALAYFVIPIDAIPDITPFAGFADDLGILVAAIAMVVTHIKPRHRDLADERLVQWFGSDEESRNHARV